VKAQIQAVGRIVDGQPRDFVFRVSPCGFDGIRIGGLNTDGDELWGGWTLAELTEKVFGVGGGVKGMNRRNFIKIVGAALATFLAKWRVAPLPERRELDAIDAMDYCADDGKMSMAGMDGERSSIWQSDGGAETWSEAGTPEREGRITALYMASPDRWFIGYEDGELWETSDAGETWKRQEYELIGEQREPDIVIGGAS